jgi:hypothetical protein
MVGNTDILQSIIRQAAKAYHTWQIEPLWVAVEKNEQEVNCPEILAEISLVGSQHYLQVSKTIELDNYILILTSQELDIPINATLTLESHDNLFTITKAEYAVIAYHKYQVFSNYLKISLKDYGNYVPFHLEFLKVRPGMGTWQGRTPFGHAFGHLPGCHHQNRECHD